MKSIFITGIAGMLGSNIAYSLREKYHVAGVDLHEISMEGVHSKVFSALDLSMITAELKKNKTDIFIHCAALVNVDEWEVNPEYATLVNTTSTKNLSWICKELGIKMIFISTDAVFDGKRSGLYKEEDPPNPISVYGKTKLRAEEEVLKQEKNLVIRTNIYGFNYREKSSFGEWILNSLISNTELNMFHDIYFSPILVNELAEIIDLCIHKDLQGLYHICSTGSISKYEIALAFMQEFKINGCINRVSMEQYEFQAPRTKNMGLSNQKICEELGISIRTPLEGVKEFKKLHENHFIEQLRRNLSEKISPSKEEG